MEVIISIIIIMLQKVKVIRNFLIVLKINFLNFSSEIHKIFSLCKNNLIFKFYQSILASSIHLKND
jgi:hypothetical protein